MQWRLSKAQKRKYQAAEQLGLLTRLQEAGWAGLTAKETGQVGAQLRHPPHQQE